jgi:biopolymer transport protein ExbD
MVLAMTRRFVEGEGIPWRGQEGLGLKSSFVSFVDSKNSEAFQSINVTPLTDVMLVLLITFLLSAGTFNSSDQNVPLPQVQRLNELEQTSVVLTVDETGQVLWPEGVVNGESPEQMLSALLRESSSETLALAVHRSCGYGPLFRILNSATSAGWPEIVLLTETESTL